MAKLGHEYTRTDSWMVNARFGQHCKSDGGNSRFANHESSVCVEGDKIPWEDLDALAEWTLGKVSEGKMSAGRLRSIFDSLQFKANKEAANGK